MKAVAGYAFRISKHGSMDIQLGSVQKLLLEWGMRYAMAVIQCLGS